jgi:hypothetical protein
MYNLVKAAEAGWRGSVADALDYELLGPFGPAESAARPAALRAAGASI